MSQVYKGVKYERRTAACTLDFPLVNILSLAVRQIIQKIQEGIYLS